MMTCNDEQLILTVGLPGSGHRIGHQNDVVNAFGGEQQLDAGGVNVMAVGNDFWS